MVDQAKVHMLNNDKKIHRINQGVNGEGIKKSMETNGRISGSSATHTWGCRNRRGKRLIDSPRELIWSTGNREENQNP
jgi:hypothetical protein